MKRWIKCIVLVFVTGLLAAEAAANENEEGELINLLRSDAPNPAKDEACQKLKGIGSVKSVAALAALLEDPALSHSARYALEAIEAPEAAAALREGLAKTEGLTRAGIIDSLGQRRDRQSVDALKELARQTDEQVAAAAVTALGRIGGAEAVGALRAARSNGSTTMTPLVLEAMLACADSMRAGGFRQDAVRVYREVHNADDAPEPHRTAAFRGLVLAAGDEAIALLEKALAGTDRADLLAGLRLVPEFEAPEATAALAGLLPTVPPGVRVALIEGLAQRGDGSATPAVGALARDPAQPEAVRIAALRALAALGDASVVPMLAGLAAERDGALRDAARQALVRLNAGGVREAIVERITQAERGERVELVRALGQRYDRGAAGVLMDLAEDAGDEAVRAAAFQSLAMVGDDALIEPLVRMVARAGSEERRAAAERTLRAVAGRAGDAEQAARSVAVGLAVADPAAAGALLRAVAVIPVPGALAALREGTRSVDLDVADAAVRALAGSSYGPAARELLAIARDPTRSEAQRVLALRGCVRLADEVPSVPAPERAALLKDALGAAIRVEEKRLALSALGRVADVAALTAVEAALADPAVLEEAALACFQIARAVSTSHPAAARGALDKLVASGAGEKVMAEAKALREKVGG